MSHRVFCLRIGFLCSVCAFFPYFLRVTLDLIMIFISPYFLILQLCSSHFQRTHNILYFLSLFSTKMFVIRFFNLSSHVNHPNLSHLLCVRINHESALATRFAFSLSVALYFIFGIYCVCSVFIWEAYFPSISLPIQLFRDPKPALFEINIDFALDERLDMDQTYGMLEKRHPKYIDISFRSTSTK